MKSMWKRVTAFVLASTMALAVPLSSFADGSLAVNANSGGGVAAGNDPNYAAKFHAYPQNQGIRMSLVDKDGDRIANSVDVVGYVPSKLLTGYTFGEGNGIYTNRYSGSEAEIGKYTARFIDWIGWKKLGNKRDKFEYSNGIKTEKYTGVSWAEGVTKGVPPHMGKYGMVDTVMIPRAAFNQTLLRSLRKDAESHSNVVFDSEIEDLVSCMTEPSFLNSDGAFTAGGQYLKTAFEARVRYGAGSGAGLTAFTESNYNIASYILNMPTLQYDNTGKLVSNNVVPLFRILDGVQGKEKLGTTKEDGNKYTLTDLMAEYKYRMIVEPIYWYVPEVITTNAARIAKTGTLHENQLTSVRYGTASYIAKETYEEMKAAGYSDALIHDCSVGPDWGTGSLGITTMMVDKDDTDLGVYQCQGAHTIDYTPNSNLWSLYSLGANNNAKENGYSVFIFKGEFFKPKTPATHTFDSKNFGSSSGNGYHRAPAPDPNSDPLSDPTQDPNPNKKIVKIYARKAGANSFIYEDTQVRVNTVSPIKIEDEEEYTVDNWFTSNVDKFPSSGNGSAGVNDYGAIKGSIPNKQTGTGTTTTSLEDNDVLYVRLV